MNVNAMLSKRRAFLKWMAVLPTLGVFAVEELFAKAQRSNARANVYTRIGVTPIINARGRWTYISGSHDIDCVTTVGFRSPDELDISPECRSQIGRPN
jgi:hypothetical protein